MIPDRLRCLIPGCRRTIKHRPECMSEWICGPHWRGVPKSFKRVLARARRRALKHWPRQPHRKIFFIVWERCKRAAFDAAAGL